MAPPPTEKLLDAFARLPVTDNLVAQVQRGARCKAGGLWGASAALLLTVLRRTQKQGDALLVLTADDVDSLQLQTDLAAFGGHSLVLPREETGDDDEPDAQTRSERQRTLQRFADDPAPLIAGIEALLQPVATPRSLKGKRLQLRAGQPLDRDQVLQRARAAGLRSVPLVLAPGECSVRGDIVDVFPMAAESAVRLEFFDDTLESIRSFDPATQRTTEVHDTHALSLTGEQDVELGSALKHLNPARTLVVLYEPLRIEERTSRLSAFDHDFPKILRAVQDTLQRCPHVELSSLPSHDYDYKVLSAGSAVGSGEADPGGRLRSVRGMKGRVLLFCRSGDERERLREIFRHKDVDLKAERVDLLEGAISKGFRIPDLQTTALSNVEFAGVAQQPRVRERAVVPSRAIQSFFELGPGDLVVHAVHGVARFEGTELVHRGEGTEEHLRLCFQDDVKLLVPASKIHLVQKYVGSGGTAPLDKLGGKGFQRRKEQVQEALFDLAAELLEVQSQRALVRRDPYPQDQLERDFLDAFPFRDTTDQGRAWNEIQRDLEQTSPMDRLLCGDVGFGKTEIAHARRVSRWRSPVARSRFWCRRRCCAEQHWPQLHAALRAARPASWRRSPAIGKPAEGPQGRRSKACAEGPASTSLIGTHRLLGKDMSVRRSRAWSSIDEEQRFGVRQKEHFKQAARRKSTC